MIPGAAVVINLARRTDRRENFLARYGTAGLGGIALRIYTACEDEQNAPPGSTWRAYPRGTYGCWRSHVGALAASSGPTLIFEDDAVFSPELSGYLTVATLPGDWQVLHLGGQHLTPPERVVPGLVRPVRMLRTHAYLARNPSMLAAALAAHRTHVDYAFARLTLPRYAVDPWLVGQDDSPGDITRLSPNGIDFW